MGFPREECWSGLPCPPPGDLPDPGIEPESLDLLPWQAGSSPLVPPGKSTLFVQDYNNWPAGAYWMKRTATQQPIYYAYSYSCFLFWLR